MANAINWTKTDKGYDDKANGLYIRKLENSREWVVILKNNKTPAGTCYGANLGKTATFDNAERNVIRILALIRKGQINGWCDRMITDTVRDRYDANNNTFTTLKGKFMAYRQVRKAVSF